MVKPPGVITASAANLTTAGSRKARPKKPAGDDWQTTCWTMYDLLEPLHYYAQWIGYMLSRATLHITKDGKPDTTEAAVAILNDFYGGPDGHPEFLRMAGIQMSVAGEGYIVGREVDGEDEWEIAAAVKVKVSAAGVWKVRGEEIDPNTDLLLRIWRSHPVDVTLADSPIRPLLPVLSQLNELTKYVSAQVDSRLAGAGILALPLEMATPTIAETKEGDTALSPAQKFAQDLADNAAAAKEDRTDASAVVPLIVLGPAEHLDKIQHITFWSGLDENAPELRKELIHRFALGVDMPTDALEGSADTNHWSAWQIEDSLIKSHTEPLLKLIVAAVTEQYLRPLLMDGEGAMDETEAKRYAVAADPTGMHMKPNRSKESLELHDRGIINEQAVRRENGFDESDAMKDDEKKTWIIQKLAQGSPSPELVQRAVELLGIEVGQLGISGDDSEPRGERPLPRNLDGHPTRELPDTRDAEAAALLATAEAAVFRALERVGNRAKTARPRIEGIPDEVAAMDRYLYAALSRGQLDHVMSGAWSHLERLTLPSGVDLSTLEAHLDNYVRMLITNQQPFDRTTLARYLGRVTAA